jgi:hypothetical protein
MFRAFVNRREPDTARPLVRVPLSGLAVIVGVVPDDRGGQPITNVVVFEADRFFEKPSNGLQQKWRCSWWCKANSQKAG